MSSPHLLLFFFLLILPLSSLSKPCPPCGSTPVPFPLSTSPSCGDPSYAIRCSPSSINSSSSSSSLFFDALNSSSYPITSISPSAQRLVIRPSPFSSSSSCTSSDLPSQGLHLNSSLPFNITSSNTILLLNCTQELLLSPLNCSSTSLCHSYINATLQAAPCARGSDNGLCCTFGAGGSSTSYDLRISATACSAYESFVNLDPSVGAGSWGPRAGVELQWVSPREPLCRTQVDCEDGLNATCQVDTLGGGVVKRCFCVQGLTWDPFTGACVNSEFRY